MKRLLRLILLCGALSAGGFAACSSSTFGGFTCVSKASGFSSAASRNQSISVTAGDMVLYSGMAVATGSTLTVSGSGSCAGTINTLGGTVSMSASQAIFAVTKATSTGTCTITLTRGASATLQTSIWDFQGSNGYVDVYGATTSVTGTSNLNCPAATTTIDGDLVVCMFVDNGNNGNTFTAVAPFAITAGGNPFSQEVDVQGTHGAIIPQFSYGQSSTFGVVTVSLMPSTAPPPASFTLSQWNGITPAGGSGGLNQLNGKYINPTASFLGSFNGQTTPFSAIPVQNFIDMSGLSNGVTPTGTTFANSTFGTAGTSWVVTQVAAGMTGSTGTTFGALPEPVLAGGVAYGQSGPLSLHCTSSINGAGTATSCGSATVTVPSAGPSVSVGYWYTTPNCNSGGSQDCGAVGILSGGTDYVNIHVNAGPEPCPQNGLFLESHGGNSGGCLPYTNGAVYRVNGQQNTGHAALTVTFSNGSAVVSATNSLAVNQPVRITTTGSLPTNFNLQLLSGTYTSGATATGTIGQTCVVSGFNGGGSGATALLYLLATNNLPASAGLSFTALGSGYTSAPTSATLSSGTATCSGTIVVATVLATAPLFVSATGLSGSQFELAAVQGGTPIVAGSAGSGTHTATQLDLVTVCQVNGTSPNLIYLGTLQATTDTSASTPATVQFGISGEGPTIAGFDFYLGGYVVDNTGKISLTECIL